MNDELQVAKGAADPTSYSWVTYAWVILLSAWGGLVRFLNTVRYKAENWKEAAFHLFIGIVTSAFVGVITFYLCEAAKLNPLVTAIFVAATGHMGAEIMKFFEDGIRERIRRFLGVSDSKN